MTGAYTMLRNIAVSGFSVAIVVNEVRPPLEIRVGVQPPMGTMLVLKMVSLY